MALMVQRNETLMKKTAEKHKVMDGEKDGDLNSGEVKTGTNSKHSKSMHINTSESVRRSSRPGEMREGEKKTQKKKNGKGTRTDKGSEDENGEGVKEKVMKKSGGQGKSEVVYLCLGEEKNFKKDTHCELICTDERGMRWRSVEPQTVSIHEDTDRKQIREERDQKDESSDAAPYVVWVQCSKPECGKWRRLSDGVDPSVLPDDWTCQSNTDPALKSCSDPEEKSSVPEEEMFFCSLVPGSLVWARQSGYPWWPAMVEQDPNTEEYLEFRREVDFMPQVDKGLNDSISMAKEALKLSLKKRLVKFGFSGRYVSDRESSEDSDIAEMLELFCGRTGKDSDEDLLSKKQSTGKKTSRKREGKRSRWGKEDDETYRVGDKKKRLKKKLKKIKEHPKDQTVPQVAMETNTDMTFDMDIHSEEEEMERQREIVMHVAEKMKIRAGEGRDDEDGDGEYKDFPNREVEESEEEQEKFFLKKLVEE
ncbi:MORC family CW-type zinc finger protein 3 [Silurus asotus]|uniref:MORC family CW-type zinc finger protein 3 n=1 Tax=Silurus asotus TaxID=30991 RepID=A0AAD5A4R6_SILAS|nr:MORC family CW-type zinc finger protein 3 [Silurus asotus]